MTRLQRSPTSDGSSAAVVASERFVREHSLQDKAVEIVAQAMMTDPPETFSTRSMIDVVGSSMVNIR